MDQGKVIRFSLVALPAGILVLGVASVFITHILGGRDVETEKAKGKQEQAAEIMRRPVGREALEKYVTTLAGDIGERNLANPGKLRAAAFWIESTIGPSNMGYAVDRQKYEVDGKSVWNVVAELPGSVRAQEIVIVGAHYDTAAGGAGFNDNATGVAALLSVANALSGSNPSRTVRFVAFANGEAPSSERETRGSLVYARQLAEVGAKVVAVVNLDSLGAYRDAPGSQRTPEGWTGEPLPDTGNFIALVGDGKSRPLVDAVAGAYGSAGVGVPARVVILPEAVGDPWGAGDHASFRESGYPAVLVTDTGALRGATDGPATETPEAPEAIDFARFTEVVKGLQQVVESLATP